MATLEMEKPWGTSGGLTGPLNLHPRGQGRTRRIRCLYRREPRLQGEGKDRAVSQLVQSVVVISELLDQHSPPGWVQEVLKDNAEALGPSPGSSWQAQPVGMPQQPLQDTCWPNVPEASCCTLWSCNNETELQRITTEREVTPEKKCYTDGNI